jgi:hypothetical protein
MNKEKMEIVKAQSSVKRNKRRIQKTTKKKPGYILSALRRLILLV